MQNRTIPKKIIRLLYYLLPTTYYLLTALPAHAVRLRDPLGSTPENPLEIPTLAGTILKTLLGVTGSVALLMFIWGGFLWLTSGGNLERIKKGKETLVWAAIGLAFIFSSYIIANFVIQALTGRL